MSIDPNETRPPGVSQVRDIVGAVMTLGLVLSGLAPILPVTRLIAYVADPDLVVQRLGLVPVGPAAANVVLVAPQDLAILENPAIRRGMPVAPLPVVLADLLALPGRYPQQAEALMDALAKIDPKWR